MNVALAFKMDGSIRDHGEKKVYGILLLNQDHVVFYLYRRKMKNSYLSVAAMLSSVSLTSHRHKSSLQIRWTMATNCFLPHGSLKNNANGWKDLSPGSTRLCSCGMQMHEA